MQSDRWEYLDLLVEDEVVIQINVDEVAEPGGIKNRYEGNCITSVMSLLGAHGWQVCGFARNDGQKSRFLFKRPHRV